MQEMIAPVMIWNIRSDIEWSQTSAIAAGDVEDAIALDVNTDVRTGALMAVKPAFKDWYGGMIA